MTHFIYLAIISPSSNSAGATKLCPVHNLKILQTSHLFLKTLSVERLPTTFLFVSLQSVSSLTTRRNAPSIPSFVSQAHIALLIKEASVSWEPFFGFIGMKPWQKNGSASFQHFQITLYCNSPLQEFSLASEICF